MTWLAIAQVAGGVVLFLVGMQSLSTALRTAAGDRLRAMLTVATASRARGLALGTAVGFLAHSSAATVMTVGFVNAGLLSLVAAVPVLFGANIGTTLSMQIISFRLTDYALVAVAVGGAIHLASVAGRWRILGQAILGFGLLFYGMRISGEAIVPYRDMLEPWLARIDGTEIGGRLLGVAVAALVTGLVQSSGAVIGMTFVLAGAGVFTSLWQTFPIVLGAHIGTTITAVIASFGTSAEARRAALANVAFNFFNAALGTACAGLLVPWLQATAPDVVHQTANAHTAVMLVAAIIMLPLTRSLAAALRKLAWPRAQAEVASHLDPRLLTTPEDAFLATVRELGRCTNLAITSFRVVLAAIAAPESGRSFRGVRLNEAAIDEIKASIRSYMAAAAANRELTNRQALLAQALNRCGVELERIGDHVDRLRELISAPVATKFDPELRAEITNLMRRALAVVELVGASFSTEDLSFDPASWATLEARNRYLTESAPVKNDVTERLSRREVLPAVSLAFSEIATTCDRIVRHCAVIAQEQRQPGFAIKRERLGKPAGDQL